jgi:signal peptidase I
VNLAAFQNNAPRRGDIVIFKPPVPANAPFIKRIIGIPGDRVRIQGGTLYVNSKPLRESFVLHPINYDLRIDRYRLYVRLPGESSWDELDPKYSANPARSKWQAADRVPSGYYLVLGDNRNDSEDSHVFGLVARNSLQGKVVKIL